MSQETPSVFSDLPRLIERMHRRYLDVVRREMESIGVRDISPTQVMMIAALGTEDISVRDLVERGYYLSSNASYNLKNLVEGGYIDRQTAARDKRSARLKLSDKGLKVLAQLTAMDQRIAESLLQTGQHDLPAFESTFKMLRKLERRWSDAVHYAHDADEDF